MANRFLETIGGFFTKDPLAPQPLGDVSVTTCGLVEIDEALCARLGVGEELPMNLCPDGRVAVMSTRSKTQAPVGYLPDRETPHVAKLMGSRASLGCRVVDLDRGQGKTLGSRLVRVRITIRM